jgi:hypothetical protein
MSQDRIRNFKNFGKDQDVSYFAHNEVDYCRHRPPSIFGMIDDVWVLFMKELRRRRTDQSVELRKARKDEQLSKRRNIDTDEIDGVVNNPLSENNGVTSTNVLTEDNIRQVVEGIFR